MDKIKVLFIGNVPNDNNNSIGGANTYTKALLDILKNEKTINLQFIQIRRRWFKFGQILDYVIFPFKFLSKVTNTDVVSIHATWDFHITIGPFIVILSRIFNKKIIYHFFGGQFHNLYQEYPYILKKWLDVTIFKSNFKLMETKRMINFFSDKKRKNFVWFPNSRKPYINEIKDKKFSKKFVFISRVSKTKGVDYIIDVAKTLPLDYTIDVYGPLDNCYSEEDLNLGVVAYKGVLKPDEVVRTLLKYDVLLLPTFHEGEGYPGIFIEAMSIGMPIISTNWNALDELIDDKYNGKLIPVKSTQHLVEAVEFFNEANYKQMSQNALIKFENFDIDIISKKLINLYLC